MTTYTVYNPSGGMEAEPGQSLADATEESEDC
jgi:hypothetical protein